MMMRMIDLQSKGTPSECYWGTLGKMKCAGVHPTRKRVASLTKYDYMNFCRERERARDV